MLNTFKIRINQGSQAIPDIKKAIINPKHLGLPQLSEAMCKKNCSECKKICPTNAINIKPLTIDLGMCVFCGKCEKACKNNGIKFTNFHKIASTEKSHLIINSKTTSENYISKAIKVRDEIKKIFGRSLKLRQVSAGGCNGCEMELAACTNVNFDMQRFGIDIVASPRHADGIIITGPITINMSDALVDAYKSTPDPKLVIVAGACTISGGVFAESKALKRDFIDKYPIDLYIPGCPVHPLTVINGILSLIGK